MSLDASKSDFNRDKQHRGQTPRRKSSVASRYE